MKQIFLTILAITLFLSAGAQNSKTAPDNSRNKGRTSIESIITDLTPAQKSRIDAITSHSSKLIEDYRQQLKVLRDSIRTYMNTTGDLSNKLFPLYDREGRLQAEISKEYYKSKIAIDKVLNSSQLKKFRDEVKKKARNKLNQVQPSPSPQSDQNSKK